MKVIASIAIPARREITVAKPALGVRAAFEFEISNLKSEIIIGSVAR
jgi:hypothetical protein